MMLRRRIAGMGLLACLAVAATGCSRSPRVTFYTLEPRAQQEAVVPATVFPTIAVGAITLPETVDRQQLVVRGEGNRVDILELHRWAAPLKSEIPRLLAENLGRLLGSDRVSAYPQNASSDADCRVLVDFRRFESVPGGGVTIDATWTIRRTSGGAPQTGRSQVKEPVDGTGYDATVAAYSRALAAMSRDIAQALRTAAPAP